MVKSGASVLMIHVNETVAYSRLHRYATSDTTIVIATGAILAKLCLKLASVSDEKAADDEVPTLPNEAETSCWMAATAIGKGNDTRISLVEMDVTAELQRNGARESNASEAQGIIRAHRVMHSK
eukprot:scaffold271459_cov33-Tisochrysis_lutea.AAC.3